MEDRFAVTFETGGTEVFSFIKPMQWTGTLEEVREFVSENKGSLLAFHIYQLFPVLDDRFVVVQR